MGRVIKVPPIEDGSTVRSAAFTTQVPAQSPARPAGVAGTPPTDGPLLFDMDGLDGDEASMLDPVTDSAVRTKQAVASLLKPGLDDEQVSSAVTMAVASKGSSLESIARVLASLGYTVKRNSTAGGSLRSLKHTYLTAIRHSHRHGPPSEWVVDPHFLEAFTVSSAIATPRYAHILEAVSPVLVAPLRRVVRAVLLLGAELARCFEKQGVPLPPWRHADSIATKYDAVSSVEVHKWDGPAQQAVPAAPSAGKAGMPAVTARAPGSEPRRVRQQQERVRLRLARLGLLPEEEPASLLPVLPAEVVTAKAVRQEEPADSPRSVLEAAQEGSFFSRSVAFHAKGTECFCCGSRLASRWPPRERQPQPQPGIACGRASREPAAAAPAA